VTRYELLDRIGVGGMAEIFRAKAVAAGGFEKPVAIKKILPHLSQDKRFVSLLIAEAKVLSQLRHRNIVQIFDVGLGDDGQYFLVMEFVDGTDLGAVQKTLETRRRRLPLDLVLHVGAEVCEALEHAHGARAPDGVAMRLVHRDVSPSNVLLSRAGEVKLTDFGIAKRAEEHTGHGAVRGKFAYISPEQARNEPVDARSDVFSVGVLMYEMCLGKRLFSQLPDLDALRAVREVRVPRPSEVDATLPREVEAVLLSALARDPALRPASAGQLGATLRSIRYSLDEAAGDPATELGKIVESAAKTGGEPTAPTPPKVKRETSFDQKEPTFLRIRTADEFQDSDGEGTAVLRARDLIDRFEEEETRMASVGTGDLARLRARRDSGELTQAATPMGLFARSESDDSATRLAARPELPEARSARLAEARGKSARKPRAATRPPPLPDRKRDATPPPPLTIDATNEPTTLAELDWTPGNAPPAAMPSRTKLGPPGAPPPASAPAAPSPPVPSFGGMPLPGAPPLPKDEPPMMAFAPPPPGSAFDAHGRPVMAIGGPVVPGGPMRSDQTAPSRHDPTGVRPHRPSLPFVEGFARIDDSRRTMLLVVGAIITGILGFAITRAIIGGDDPPATTPAVAPDAAPPAKPDAKPAKTGATEGSGSAATPAAPAAAVTADPGAGSGAGSVAGAGSGSATGGGSTLTVTPIEPAPATVATKPKPVKPPARKPPPKPVKKPPPKPVKKKGR
jgi:serine/threonine-protein kinase